MKRYDIENYVRYTNDLKGLKPKERELLEYSRDELIIKFLPLVENLARKFPTSEIAIGILNITDLIQIGSEALVLAVDKLDYEHLKLSRDVEKTLKSFFSKRIKGAIRRRIDMNRGSMRIPEYKRNMMRKDSEDKKNVEMFFRSIFLTIDDGNDNNNFQDKTEPYNINILNAYLKGIMQKHLTPIEYEVLRMSYGLDCNKHSGLEIANVLGIKGINNFVRVSEIKKKAVDKLIDSVDYNQFIDIL
jgi:RNA polymerase sigma factor (sigma-70 family)